MSEQTVSVTLTDNWETVNVSFSEAAAGDSAYRVWLAEGNTGSEQAFLNSLKGDSAYQVWLDNGNTGSEEDFLAWLWSAARGAITPRHIAFVGDSNVQFTTSWPYSEAFSSFFARSDDDLAAHTGSAPYSKLKIYSNGTAQLKLAGDAYGPLTPCGDGIIWLESSNGKGCGFYIVASHVAAAAVGGTEYDLDLFHSAPSGYEITPFSWAQMLTGHKLIANVFGIGGQKSSDFLARFGSVFGRDSFGRPVDYLPDIVVINAPINDVTYLAGAGPHTFTLEDTLANLAAMKDAAVARGARVIFTTAAREAPTPAEFLVMQGLNAGIYAMAAGSSMVEVADTFLAVRDPEADDGSEAAGYMSGPHYSREGAIVAARILVEVVNRIAGVGVGRSPFRFAGDTANLATNGAMLGTAGVLTQEALGFPGTITGVSAWDVGCANGTVVASKESAAGETPWQVYTFTDTGVGGGGVLAHTPLASVPEGEAFAAAEVHVSDLTKFSSLSLYVAFYDGSDDQIEHFSVFNTFGNTAPVGCNCVDESFVLRTPPFTPPAAAVSARVELMAIAIEGETPVVKFRAAGVKTTA